MKIKLLTAGIFSAVAMACIAITGVSAATVDDVANAARARGVSEQIIQEAYNQYYQNPGKYTSEDFENSLISLEYFEGDLNEVISEYFKVTVTNVQTQTNSNQNGGNVNQTTTTAAKTEDPVPTEKRPVTPADFIAMTLEQKIAFVASLPEHERYEFMNSLTEHERNSILKQLPTKDKLDILNNLINAGNSMGMNFQVDEITEDSFTLSVRDSNGRLVDVGTMSGGVEDTGFDYRVLALTAGGVIAASFTVILIISRKMKKDNGHEHEKI